MLSIAPRVYDGCNNGSEDGVTLGIELGVDDGRKTEGISVGMLLGELDGFNDGAALARNSTCTCIHNALNQSYKRFCTCNCCV